MYLWTFVGTYNWDFRVDFVRVKYYICRKEYIKRSESTFSFVKLFGEIKNCIWYEIYLISHIIINLFTISTEGQD